MKTRNSITEGNITSWINFLHISLFFKYFRLIENIYVRNIEVGECREAVLKINLQYENREKCDRSFPPVVRHVYLDNVTSEKSKYGVLITGYDDRVNIEDIHVTNSRFNNVEKKGNLITGAKDVVLNEVYINGNKVRK